MGLEVGGKGKYSGQLTAGSQQQERLCFSLNAIRYDLRGLRGLTNYHEAVAGYSHFSLESFKSY